MNYAKAGDIDFSSASKLKNNLDSSIETVNTVKSETYERSQTGVAEKPTDDEINDFLKSLSECKTKPVCLFQVQGTLRQYQTYLKSHIWIYPIQNYYNNEIKLKFS